MHGSAHLLVIGPTALATAVADALPQCKSVATDSLLKGIWTIGHDEFDGVVIAVSLGQRVHTAIRSLRAVAPDTRIVVTCPPQEEPSAREILDRRFARGEISREEYDLMRETISEGIR